MKKSEIILNHTYTDNKGNVRLVIEDPAIGWARDNQQNCDVIRYRILKKKSGPYLVGSEPICTRRSFASWAKADITDMLLKL